LTSGTHPTLIMTKSVVWRSAN